MDGGESHQWPGQEKCYLCNSLVLGRPIAWVVTSEIYPLKIRGWTTPMYTTCMIVLYTHLAGCTLSLTCAGFAVSITTTANWTGNFVIAFSTPLLLNSFFQTYGTFYILSGFLLMATLFVLFTLPETKVSAVTSKESKHAWPSELIWLVQQWPDQSFAKLPSMPCPLILCWAWQEV